MIAMVIIVPESFTALGGMSFAVFFRICGLSAMPMANAYRIGRNTTVPMPIGTFRMPIISAMMTMARTIP
ncbi:hypothetical protein D3C80_2161160 [compost metagenome]